MKMYLYKLALTGVAALVMSGTGFAAANAGAPPIPGTRQSQDTKSDCAQNNTPRNNPTPNPEPDSQPPGPEVTRVIIVQPGN